MARIAAIRPADSAAASRISRACEPPPTRCELPALSLSDTWLIPYPLSPSASSRLGWRFDAPVWTIVRCRWTNIAQQTAVTNAVHRMSAVRPESGVQRLRPARACALQSCGACSRRGRGRIARCTARRPRLGLDARDRALATRLAYGAVQRRATLDHLIERARRPPGRPARAAVLRRAAARALPARLPRPRAGARRRRRVGRAGQARRARAARARQRRAAPGRARGARARRALPERRRPQAALRHSHPEWIAELWWEALGADDARALMAADNEPAEAALRVEHAARRRRPALAARLPVRQPRPRRACPRALVLDGPFDAFGSPAVGARQLHAAVARGDGGRAPARPAARRARARPVRGAGRARRRTSRR